MNVTQNDEEDIEIVDQTYLPGETRDRIQDLIKNKKITQAELARRIGLSESALSRYLKGETKKLGDGFIIKIAKQLNVSADFLLGETDIPDRKNYDIEELGLSAKAAKLLYTGKIDSGILNILLEDPRFPRLTAMLSRYRDRDMKAGIAIRNQQDAFLYKLLLNQAEDFPESADTAMKTAGVVQSVYEPEISVDLVNIQTLFMKIVTDIKEKPDSLLKQNELVTAEVMEKLRENLTKGEEKLDLQQLTPEQIADAIIQSAANEQFPAERLSGMKTEIVKMFVPPKEPPHDE